jgi:integrase
MATTRVGVYRKYHGPVPAGPDGRPLSPAEWVRHRVHTWSVRWFGTDGKRYSKSFDTRKEADRFAETKQTEIRDGKGDPPPRITMRDYYREHSRVMKGNIAQNTLRLHRAAMEQLAASVGWDRSLDSVKARDIERFRAQRLETGITPSSANKEIKILRRIFNLAIMRGYLPQGQNPSSGIPMLRVAPKRPAYVNPDQFQGIYRQAKSVYWQALLVTLYSTALRLDEAMNLLWQDIDFESGQLHVTRKTAEDPVQAWTPKDCQMRTIPLPDRALDLLAAWQGVAPVGCPYVFMEAGRWEFYREATDSGRWRPGQHLMNNMLRRFKTICHRADVGPITIHDLRRSCITNWAQHLPIHVVQQLAGHSSIKTTQQFYLSIQIDDVKKAQAVQAAVLAGIPEAILTDPKLTQTGKKRRFPGRQGCQAKAQVPE